MKTYQITVPINIYYEVEADSVEHAIALAEANPWDYEVGTDDPDFTDAEVCEL